MSESEPAPEPYEIRVLTLEDQVPFLKLLSQFRPIPPLDAEAFFDVCTRMQSSGSYPYVMIDPKTGQLLATATLHVELKFIHNLGKVAHFEDLVVDSAYRGRHLGLILSRHLRSEAQKLGCYKMILNCVPELERYYHQAGFSQSQIQMSVYLDSEA